MKSKLLLSGLILSLSNFGANRASARLESDRLRDVFMARVDSGYESSRCGENIDGLIKAAIQDRVNVRSAHVISITNIGYSTFGMVNAEKARGSYHVRTGNQFPPGERNWYHHVILEARRVRSRDISWR